MKQFFTINKYSLIIFFLLITSLSFAQGGPPSPPDGGGGPGTVNDVPINMYWLILLIVGAYYGIKNRMNS